MPLLTNKDVSLIMRGRLYTVAYLGFCEGGDRAKDARFEASEAPMGWSVEWAVGCPLPTEEGVWGWGCAPSPKFKKKFFWFNVFKKFLRSGQRWGASPSALPLNTLLVVQ